MFLIFNFIQREMFISMYKEKFLILLSIFFFLMGCSESSPWLKSVDDSSSKGSKIEIDSKRLILKGSGLNEVSGEVDKQGGKLLRKMEHLEALVVELPVEAQNSILKRFPDLEIIEDIEFSLVEPIAADKRSGSGDGSTQPQQQLPWGIDRIGARQAHLINKGEGVTVCIVDTGLSKSHPDLSGNIIGGKNFVMSKGKLDPHQYEDDNGHGSHVGGIVAALDNTIGSIGVAPNAKLYGVKVLNRQGSGFSSDIADGIYECIYAGTQVINLSLGGSGDPEAPSLMKTAIDAAISSGLYVVAAAGNEGADIATKIPAGYTGVIAVAATSISDEIPSWSNYGLTEDDFAAPGVSVYSTWKGTGYNTISGTSMASPHMAGVVALLLSNSSLAFKTFWLNNYNISRQGAGLIDALATVQNISLP